MADDVDYQEIRGRVLDKSQDIQPTVIDASSKKNSIAIGLGASTSNMKITGRGSGDVQYSTYEDIKDLDAIANLNIALLRRISDTDFSLGLDFSVFMNGDYIESSYHQTSTSMAVDSIKATYSIYTLMVLANYEILKTDSFDLSLQYGIGYAFNALDLNVNSTYEDNYVFLTGKYSGRSNSTTMASKLGVVGTVYFSESLGFGAGAYYTMYDDPEFIFDNDVNIKLKNNSGMMSYNIYLKFRF
jgi:hypothetical protein